MQLYCQMMNGKARVLQYVSRGRHSEKSIRCTCHPEIVLGHRDIMMRWSSMRSTQSAWEGSDVKRRAAILVAEIVSCVP
jgi:hypothetical protein